MGTVVVWVNEAWFVGWGCLSLFVDVGGGLRDQDYRFRGIGKGERGVQDSVRMVNIRVRGGSSGMVRRHGHDSW